MQKSRSIYLLSKIKNNIQRKKIKFLKFFLYLRNMLDKIQFYKFKVYFKYKNYSNNNIANKNITSYVPNNIIVTFGF